MAEDLVALETDVLAGFVLARAAAAGRRHDRLRCDASGTGPGLARQAVVGDGVAGRRPILRRSAACGRQGHPAVAGASAEDLLPVPGAAAQGRDPPDDRPVD